MHAYRDAFRRHQLACMINTGTDASAVRLQHGSRVVSPDPALAASGEGRRPEHGRDNPNGGAVGAGSAPSHPNAPLEPGIDGDDRVLVIGVQVFATSRNSATSTSGAPFTWTADWQSSPGHLFRQSAAELGPSPSAASHIQWARERHGVFSLPVTVQGGRPAALGGIVLILRGKSADVPVTLLGLTLEVLERRPPIAGTRVYRPSGEGKMGRYIDFDVDAEPPRIIDSSHDPDYNPTMRQEPMQFPYQISTTVTELFLVSVRTAESDVTWRVRIAWSSGVDSGEALIDAGGSPFEVSVPGPGSQICSVLGLTAGTPYTPENGPDASPSTC